jgi:hypothetical protein
MGVKPPAGGHDVIASQEGLRLADLDHLVQRLSGEAPCERGERIESVNEKRA